MLLDTDASSIVLKAFLRGLTEPQRAFPVSTYFFFCPNWSSKIWLWITRPGKKMLPSKSWGDWQESLFKNLGESTGRPAFKINTNGPSNVSSVCSLFTACPLPKTMGAVHNKRTRHDGIPDTTGAKGWRGAYRCRGIPKQSVVTETEHQCGASWLPTQNQIIQSSTTKQFNKAG